MYRVMVKKHETTLLVILLTINKVVLSFLATIISVFSLEDRPYQLHYEMLDSLDEIDLTKNFI